MYGLSKIHKEGLPLRPIVSSIGSPTQNLSGYIAKLWQPLAEEATSYVKNSEDFLQKIKNITLNPNDILVSFDVTSLFTKIPTNEAISIIESTYHPPKDILELAKHCLKNTYFSFRGQKYKQVEGAPMGSPLSPVVANLYMTHFETTAISTSPLKPALWLRYVDDTFVIWQHGRTTLDSFLQHLNSINEKIQFTLETEENLQLPFLDVLLKRTPDGHISHTVYRKKTHTNRYLNAESNHHPAQLASVAKSLLRRANTLADREHQEQEMTLTMNALKANGFQQRLINKLRKEKPKRETDTFSANIAIPYIEGITDRIGRVLKKHNIRACYTTTRKISTLICNSKDIVPLEAQGVYEIPCGECPQSYIGQTNRRISVRSNEHILAVKKSDPKSSLV